MNRIPDKHSPAPGDASLKWIALLHVICCGGALLIYALISAGIAIPLLWVSKAVPYLAIIGAVFAAGALVWFSQRRCSSCPWASTELKKPQNKITNSDQGNPNKSQGLL